MKSIIGRKLNNHLNYSIKKNVIGASFKGLRTNAGINTSLTDNMIELVLNIF